MLGIIDSHVHMGSVAEEQAMLGIAAATGIEAMALVSIQNAEAGAGLPQSLYMKARHPGRFFVFAGLNHAARLSGGRVQTPSLAAQADAFDAMGCDGIKMIEGKPTSRRRLNVPVTDAYYAEYWARVEERGTPVIWHVNDPEEFWDPARTPGWAKQRDWGYGPRDVRKEALYAEVDAVLALHPALKIIFAHFYFLSADLPRAQRFLDEHPTVCFDLAPGIEMLYNLSRTPDASREFFVQYADRIVFGTDLASSMSVAEGRARAGIVFRWLESADTFRVPRTADFLLGPPEDGVIRGMALPTDALGKIYRKNFTRIAGPMPRTLDATKAVDECNRIAAIAAALSGKPAAVTEAAKVARMLETSGW
ncbi:amidohydrolase family protein [bacterium]|nr:amidohydrolase family protein [bacterium]